MHVLGAPILDKLTATVTALQTCIFEVWTRPEKTNPLCALTSTKTQVAEFSKKYVHLVHFHSKMKKVK